MSYEITVDVDDEYLADVDIGALEAAAVAVLQHEGVREADLTVIITSDEAVQALNQEYRGVDAPTDVLSFAAQEGDALIVDAPEELRALLARALGDVVIAYPYAERQASRFGNSVGLELTLLTAHGLLHLLGHDHATPEDEAALWALQETILAPLGVTSLSYRTYGE